MPMDVNTMLAIIAICLKKRNKNKKKKRMKRIWVKEHHNRRIDFTYQNLLEELRMSSKKDFRHFFNDATIYEELLSMIGPLIKKQDTVMRAAIPVGLRLSATLRFLATGEHFEVLKSCCKMSPKTLSMIVIETCEAIISRFKDYIKIPESQEEWRAIANDFYEKWNFPCCLGAVNGKHVAITKPNHNPSLYCSYKNFFSVVLMGLVNANYEFLFADVDISVSGREDFSHTSFGKTVFDNCVSLQDLNVFPGNERELPCVFVGNDAFQLTENFMKPFTVDELRMDQQIYNHRLNRAHQISENTFGTLFSQFGVFQSVICLAPEKVKTIVLACCYLYNFLRKKTEHHLWDEIFDKEDMEVGMLWKGSWREVAKMKPLQTPLTKKFSDKAEKVREIFMEYFNNEGKMSSEFDI